MAAVRSLTQELAAAEQLVEQLASGSMPLKWRREALDRAQQRVRKLHAAIASGKS